MLSPRKRHLLIAAGLLAALGVEIGVGFGSLGPLEGSTERIAVVVATTVAAGATAAAGLLLFRMSVRQGRLEAERLTAAELARTTRLAEIGRVAAGISHEIHNPLQGVSGYLTLLERDGTDQEKRRAHVAAIRSALVKVERLTRDLLDHANPAPPHRVEVAPYDLFQSLERALAADPRFREVTLRIDVESGVPSCFADASALERVLLNLALNAREAMEGRGRITLRARRAGAGHVELEVADEGPGVADAFWPHLFEPFRSGRGSSGLGLWISANLVRANGGTLRAERPTAAADAESRGARFVVTLPTTPA